VLSDLPLLPGGKVDRSALLVAAEADIVQSCVSERFVSSLEAEIADVWAGVLGRDSLLPTDHFFRLGGDSLLAMRLAARLSVRGYAISVHSIFRSPTIREMAQVIERTRSL
jgi:aryl carrier-like protein